jgi:hypothetical protein
VKLALLARTVGLISPDFAFFEREAAFFLAILVTVERSVNYLFV